MKKQDETIGEMPPIEPTQSTLWNAQTNADAFPNNTKFIGADNGTLRELTGMLPSLAVPFTGTCFTTNVQA